MIKYIAVIRIRNSDAEERIPIWATSAEAARSYAHALVATRHDVLVPRNGLRAPTYPGGTMPAFYLHSVSADESETLERVNAAIDREYAAGGATRALDWAKSRLIEELSKRDSVDTQ